ncbi:hypothetical protein [Modestobacter sp. VKM Ac-2978]|uniref:hypothetical protein n=1 Tax=Modestobacter sp. VKM Ac-2978 TaxID=3004132 RepID=UPI0022AAE751|nr:hypothetical protein [Modestobacter sp. VKM Ac-2978]MCZ2848427.1 hypothetical protein [Modestobacter sp. VKM Ac-2978]
MTSSGPEPAWAPPPPPAGVRGFDRSRLTTVDLLVAGGAVLYLLVGLLPWASVTLDFAGRITASGYEFSALVVLSALLLLGAGAWAVFPAVRPDRAGLLRAAPAVVLAAFALLCTLIAWLRSLDYGFQFPALLGVLVAAAVTVLAASSLLPGLRAWSGQQAGPAGAPAGSRPGEGQPLQHGGPLGGPPQYGRPHYGQPTGWGQPPYGQPDHGQPQYGQPAEPWQPPVGPDRPRPAPDH